MKKGILALFAVLMISLPVIRQTATLSAQPVTTCPNSNFNSGTFQNWQGCYGYFGNTQIPPAPPPPNHKACEVAGFLVTPQPPLYDKPLHRIIPAPGWPDGNTCDSLPNVFPGENYVVRIGDTSYTSGSWNTGKEAEMKYAVNVSNQSYLFIYRYAVVLQNGGHNANMQPDFQVMITDADGVVLDSTCGYYYISAPPTGQIWPGWHSCVNNISWKDWTTVGLNLTPYFGQTVYINFKVRGCYYDTHFGYAMISAYCGYLSIQTALCEGDTSATLTAPPGFTYLWSTGDTTQSITVPNPVTGAQYTCTLTAVNGCQVAITVDLTYTVINTNFTHGIACAGSPVQFNDSSWVNQNWVENWIWDYGDGSPADTGIANPQHTFALPGTYDVKLISFSTEGCLDSIMKQVHVDSIPYVTTQPLYDTICSNDSTWLTLSGSLPGTLFTWTATSGSANITGYSDNAIPTTLLNQVLVNTGPMPDTVFYTLFPHAGDCDGPDTLYRVIVNPLPVLIDPSYLRSICDSTPTSIVLGSNNDSTLFTWTCTASSASLTGYSANTTTPGTLINQVIDNTGFTTDTVYYHIVGHSYNCNGDTTLFKVAVHPTPDLTNTPPYDSICTNTGPNLVLTSNVAGAQFTWTCVPSSGNITGYSNNAVPATTLNQVLTNLGLTTEWVTYLVTPTANGCPGDVTAFTVYVSPIPIVTNTPMNQTQCSGVNTNITLTGNLPGMLFTWTATAGPGLSGYTSNPVPSTLISNVLVNSGNTTGAVTYQITPIFGGCQGNPMNYTVNVYPIPLLTNAPPNKSQCSNIATNITLTSNVASTLFTWTCTPSSANITGWANNNVPTTVLNQVLVNTGFNTEWVTYHVAPAANGCAGPPMDYEVTVYPVPNLSNSPLSKSQCDNLPTNIILTSNVAGTLFTWTCTPSSGNITGWSNNAVPTNSLNQVLDNTGFNTEWATYEVAPTANGCPGPHSFYTVTVFPTPNLSNSPPSKSQCNNQATNVTLTSNVAGTLFTWTCTPSSANITGWVNNAAPTTTLNQVLVNTGFNTEWATYHVAPMANGCAGPLTDYVVTVFPTANVTFTPPSQAICTGTNAGISLGSGVAGATFTWTATGSSPAVTGYSAGSGNTIVQTLFNSGVIPETATYTVTPSISGCPGTNGSVVVTVNPLPPMSFIPCFDPVVSINSQSVILKGGLPLGGTYAGPGVLAGLFYPNLAGVGSHIITYTYTNTWACSGMASAMVNVVALAPFACGGALTDVRDNQVYPTVLIGGQCWFAANLNYGAVIPSVQMQRDNCIPEKYCFNDIPGNCPLLGGMYQWDEMMHYMTTAATQGFCPPEWHVPTEGDWATLFAFYISNGFAGSPLKSTGYSGFNAFVLGTRFNNVQWDFNGFAVMIWSSSSHGSYKAWAHGMNVFNPSVSYYPSHRNNAFWLRCIHN